MDGSMGMDAYVGAKIQKDETNWSSSTIPGNITVLHIHKDGNRGTDDNIHITNTCSKSGCVKFWISTIFLVYGEDSRFVRARWILRDLQYFNGRRRQRWRGYLILFCERKALWYHDFDSRMHATTTTAGSRSSRAAHRAILIKFKYFHLHVRQRGRHGAW